MKYKYVNLQSKKYPMERGRCAVQAASLGMNMDFDMVFERFIDLIQARGLNVDPATEGMPIDLFEYWLISNGWEKHGSLTRLDDLPDKGTFIVELSDHATCVIDGVNLDFQDSRGRKVYCYFVISKT